MSRRSRHHAVNASWVIVEKGTLRVLFETFDQKKVAALNRERYEAVPINSYLASLTDRPLANPNLLSYRYKGQCGYVMIGALDDAGALREAARSTETPVALERLERWGGNGYAPLSPGRNQQGASA